MTPLIEIARQVGAGTSPDLKSAFFNLAQLDAFVARVKQEEAQAAEPCSGCGEADVNKRCIGCLHPFTTTAPTLSADHPEVKLDMVASGETKHASERKALIKELRLRGGDFDVPYERSHLRKLLDISADMLAADAGQTAQLVEAVDANARLLVRIEGLKRAQQVAVPQGWKLVPVEPDDDMLVAGQEAWAIVKPKRHAIEDCEEATAVYRNMLAAAPQPPQAYALALPTDLTDDEIDAAQAAAYQDLVAAGYNGGMGGLTWDRASARAVLAAQRGKV